ncbi:hypothetical protein [Herbaspirillum robiniae]|uniref:DUF4175 domain-containing protein n=1 Tax=Herbaspirillum robiniae TaxID=2014887 RepID=A0A246WKS2_9BURK|nr:hypothetical protein [Herbaspirillum robiniae]OWY26905.1 hypothetical protein CEJ42_21320 [Herbaspirillum robiniae]
MNGTWGWPLLLAALTFGGLAAGIFGDGVWDWLCWAGLAAPVWVVGRKLAQQWRGRERPDA